MKKNSFIMYAKYEKHINKLSVEQRGMLLTAIMAYSSESDIPDLDPVTDMLFGIIVDDIDSNNQKYEETKAARSRAGKESARSREANKAEQAATNSNTEQQDSTQVNTSQQSSTKVNKAEQAATNSTDNEYVYVNDNDNGYPTDTKKKSPTDSKKKSAPVRHKYGQYQHVLLSDDQYNSLLKDHSADEVEDAIQAVDDYCEGYGRHYSNYAMVIRKWGFDAAAKARQTARSGTTGSHIGEPAGMVSGMDKALAKYLGGGAP